MAQSEFHTASPSVLMDSQDGTWTDAEPSVPPSPDAPAPFSTAKSIALVASFGCFWAAMVWGVQHMTTAPTLWKEPSMLIKDHLFRFLFNWSLATLCFSVL